MSWKLTLRFVIVVASTLLMTADRNKTLAAQVAANVSIRISDPYGLQISATEFGQGGGQVLVTDDEKQLVQFDSKSLSSRMSYGRYRFRVSLPGFAPEDILASIDQPDQVVRVHLHVGKEISAEDRNTTCEIKGRVAISSVNGLSIRAIQVYGKKSLEVPVLKDKSFLLENVDCGSYFLVLMGRQACLDVRLIQAGVEVPLVFDIMSNKQDYACLRAENEN